MRRNVSPAFFPVARAGRPHGRAGDLFDSGQRFARAFAPSRRVAGWTRRNHRNARLRSRGVAGGRAGKALAARRFSPLLSGRRRGKQRGLAKELHRHFSGARPGCLGVWAASGSNPKAEGRRPKQIRTALGLGFRFSDFGPRPSFGLRVADFKANRSGGGGLTEKWGFAWYFCPPIFLSACSQKELCGLSLSYCPIPRHSDLFSPRSHFVAAGRISGSAQFQVSVFGLGFRL